MYRRLGVPKHGSPPKTVYCAETEQLALLRHASATTDIELLESHEPLENEPQEPVGVP